MKKIIPFLCSKVPGIDFKRRYGIEMKKKGEKVKIDLTLACCSNRTARCSEDRNEIVAVVDCCYCCPRWWLIGEEAAATVMWLLCCVIPLLRWRDDRREEELLWWWRWFVVVVCVAEQRRNGVSEGSPRERLNRERKEELSERK